MTKQNTAHEFIRQFETLSADRHFAAYLVITTRSMRWNYPAPKWSPACREVFEAHFKAWGADHGLTEERMDEIIDLGLDAGIYRSTVGVYIDNANQARHLPALVNIEG